MARTAEAQGASSENLGLEFKQFVLIIIRLKFWESSGAFKPGSSLHRPTEDTLDPPTREPLLRQAMDARRGAREGHAKDPPRVAMTPAIL